MNDEQKNEYGVLIAKKSEKLVTAVYLVSDLIQDTEPIKSSLRRLSVTLLSSMNTLTQPEVKDRMIEYKMSLKIVTEIISLLHVARTMGIVSHMNGSLLIDGFRSLQRILESKQSVLTEEMLTIENENLLNTHEIFSASIQVSSYDALTPLSLARNTEEYPREKDKQMGVLSRDMFYKGKTRYEKDKVDEISNKGQNIQMRTAHHVTSFQNRKSSRREQILLLFVEGVDVSIKDIASRIKGCSEKTIQRELNALVYDNAIVRIGEKRWSRYLLS